jgi:molybdopterin/thiamine biosynthesis adenylyltransferase
MSEGDPAGALDRALAALAQGADPDAWRPHTFSPALAADEEALMRLVESGAVLFRHDALLAQLAELVEVRAPDRKRTPAQLDDAIQAHLAGRAPASYGAWVFYPWSRRLVHVLPRDEYVEVRTSRNRYKITAAEQRRLAGLKVGVVGLSVGQSTAITLALEGVGGCFRLADFDTINLSNLNRLRAGAHTIGVNKGVVTARELYELDPYADVALYPGGLDERNLDEFLSGLDLVFEECDDLKLKVLLRERARALRVPVLMETSDRGMLDLERFDLEPHRPIFHGLAGELRAADLAGLTTFQKVPVVLKIVGETTMSRRLAASLVDIDSTLKSWPQLASAVALGGAVNTDAARRLVLGELRESGRYFVDLAEIVADGRAQPPAMPTDDPPQPPAPRGAPAPVHGGSARGRGPVSAGEWRRLVEHGALAPSGGNAQPWRFCARGATLDCLIDEARARTLLDYRQCASLLALGAAVENMSLAAAELGLTLEPDVFPDGADAPLVCRLRASRGAPPVDPLAHHIAGRATNRRIGARVPLADEDRRALEAAAAPGRLQLVSAPEALEEVGAILGGGDRVRYLSHRMHAELMGELRWSSAEAQRTRDGIDLATLELTPTDLAGLRLVSRWPIMETLGRLGGGAGLTKGTRNAVAAASAVGLLTTAGRDRQAYFTGGRLLERLWLSACARGLAFQPMTALLYLFTRLERGAGEGLTAEEGVALRGLRARFRQVFDVDGSTELMLFRVGRAAPPSALSLRRALEDFFEII